MKKFGLYLGGLGVAASLFSVLAFAQAVQQGVPPGPAQPGGRQGGAPAQQPMSFFVTSVSKEVSPCCWST